jgi:hypothetical protein
MVEQRRTRCNGRGGGVVEAANREEGKRQGAAARSQEVGMSTGKGEARVIESVSQRGPSVFMQGPL